MNLTREDMEVLISLFDWVDNAIGLVPDEIELKEKIERCLENGQNN
jgi:hypothetical protein